MDVDAAPVGQTVQVVDPEVRAYVYSLLTAVGIPTIQPVIRWLTMLYSSAVSTARMHRNIAWETTLSPVCAISRSGSSCTMKKLIAWTWRDVWEKQTS
jgi:hypothetical protein